MEIRRCARNCKRRAPPSAKGDRAAEPASQETCLRRRPHPAGTSLRCVAPRGRQARAAPPRRHSCRFRRTDMTIYLASALRRRPPAIRTIVVTASRDAGRRAADAPVSVDRDRRRSRSMRDLALPRPPICCASRRACRSRPPGRAAPRPRSASAAPRPTTPCCSSTASASTIPPPATRRGSRLLTSDGLSRIEVVRGPQSALWGSEALGGVIALETRRPIRPAPASRRLANMAASTALALRPGAMRRAGDVGVSVGRLASRSDGHRHRSAAAPASATASTTRRQPQGGGEAGPTDEIGLGVVGYWIEADERV